MQSNEMSLDDLFAAAKRHINIERAKPPAAPEALFANPDNWTRTRGIALIHEETETLLGNFSEYIHKTVAGARKLIREDAPLAVAATERVSGDWWIQRHEEVIPAETWHVRKEAMVDVLLPSLSVHSPATPVSVLLSYGAIARVELQVETTFAQLDGASEQLLMLPAGTNILPVMSQDSKVALRIELERA